MPDLKEISFSVNLTSGPPTPQPDESRILEREREGFDACTQRAIVAAMMPRLVGVFAVIAAMGFCQAEHGTMRRKGDGGPATKAQINAPSAIAVDHNGNLYVYESDGAAVRRIDGITRIITTVVEGCSQPWRKPRPTGCAGPISDLRVDPRGDLLFSEFTYDRLSRFDLHAGTLAVVAGIGDWHSSGDGGFAIDAGITGPDCFTFDSQGNIIVGDGSHYIRRINAQTGIISRVAGNGRLGSGGDQGPALDAEFGIPVSVAVDGADNIYVADDRSNRIRRIAAASGIIETVGGSGPATIGSLSIVEFRGEGGLATTARFTSPRSLTLDHDGNLLFTTAGRLCRIDKQGHLRTIAGVGQDGFGGDGGLATKARIGPVAITVDDEGNVFLAEYGNNRIRRIDAKSSIITTVGGNGLPHRPPQAIM